MSRYELKRTSDGQFLFNLKAGNNEVILTSERYKAKESAEAGIESVRTNSAIDERFDRRIANDKKPYFVLKAANGEILGHSETYESTAAMENGIRSVRTNGQIGKVVDITDQEPPPPRAKTRSAPVTAAPVAASGKSPQHKFATAASARSDDLNLHIALWRAFESARSEVERWSEADAASDRASFASDAAVAIMLGGAALSATRTVTSSPGGGSLGRLFEGDAASQPLVAEFVALYDGLRNVSPAGTDQVKPLLMESAVRPRVLAMLDAVTAAWKTKGLAR